MANFKISGVWKDTNGIITDYAFHTVTTTGGITRASKKSKAEAVRLLDTPGNSAVTWIWNYANSFWSNGENVTVVNGANGKYLRSNPDSRLTDNLAHLINYDWIEL